MAKKAAPNGRSSSSTRRGAHPESVKRTRSWLSRESVEQSVGLRETAAVPGVCPHGAARCTASHRFLEILPVKTLNWRNVLSLAMKILLRRLGNRRHDWRGWLEILPKKVLLE
ncbi:hypothetical protein L1887_62333 [Cichorium endivia]|nr:hypothetical protein L1887_62333 [Cichorium endivia]